MKAKPKASPVWILVLVTLIASLASCGSPAVRALEDRHPEMTDLQLDGAERMFRDTSDGSEVLGKPTRVGVTQLYVPESGTSVNDLMLQAVAVAESHGWTLTEAFNGRSWSGAHEAGTDTIVISRPVSQTRNLGIYVTSHSGP